MSAYARCLSGRQAVGGVQVRLKRGALKLAALVLGLSIGAQVMLGCGGERDPEGAPERTEAVRGLIHQVEPKSLLETGKLTIVDEAGDVWVFQSGGSAPAGFGPSHLRDHMLSGLQVTVTFHREGDNLVIDGIAD